jgi:hypothetical protein
MIDLFLILKETSIQFSKTDALGVGTDSRLEILCLTVRRFRITKKKEWKNIRNLERWTEQQEKWGYLNATIILRNRHKVQA